MLEGDERHDGLGGLVIDAWGASSDTTMLPMPSAPAPSLGYVIPPQHTTWSFPSVKMAPSSAQWVVTIVPEGTPLESTVVNAPSVSIHQSRSSNSMTAPRATRDDPALYCEVFTK